MKNRHGFSLIEMMIALALASIVGYLGMQLADYLRRQERLARINATRNDLLSTVYSLSERAAAVVKFGDYRQQTTYSLPRSGTQTTGSAISKSTFVSPLVTGATPLPAGMNFILINPHTSPATPFRLPTAAGNLSIFKDSSTLEISSLETIRSGGVEGFLASRCIPSSESKRTDFTVTDVLSYKMRPLLPYRSAQLGVIYVLCCPEGTSNPQRCSRVDTAETLWRPRIFHVSRPYTCAAGITAGGACDSGSNLANAKRSYNTNQVKVRVFPNPAELKDVSGAGFIASFDRQSNPDSLSVRVFTADVECQRTADTGVKPLNAKCKDEIRYDFRIVDRTVTRDVHSSGMLQLGH